MVTHIMKHPVLVLKCNDLKFNDIHYLEIQGTAMDTKMLHHMGQLEIMAQVYRRHRHEVDTWQRDTRIIP